jgi:GNAT superfamily N-acetyltransferase
MTLADESDLQRFFDDNPAYFEIVLGQKPSSSEAREELTEPLPKGWSYSEQIRLGWRDENGALVAMANVTSDLLAPGVWQLGLFIVATARQGSGEAQALYGDIEAWMLENGAKWMRLGVVLGNTRAERFWERRGFLDVRRRFDVEMGARSNTLRVMVKPLTGGAIADYLQLVGRDRPDAP